MKKKIYKIDLLTEDEIDIIIGALHSSWETLTWCEKEKELIQRFKNAKKCVINENK